MTKHNFKNSQYNGCPKWQLIGIINELEASLLNRRKEIERLKGLIDFLEKEKEKSK